jgi:hypothetical protein
VIARQTRANAKWDGVGGTVSIAYAREVVVDAMTLMGELLRDTPKQNGGDAQRTRFQKSTELAPPPTLKEVGISKRESSDAQALATIKEKDPELHDEIKAAVVKVPTAGRWRLAGARGPRTYRPRGRARSPHSAPTG